MTILASLNRAYDRLALQVDMPEFGFAAQDIYFCIILDAQGNVTDKPVQWGVDRKNKPLARTMNVPYYGGRSGSNAPPYFLWDNSAYVLGVSNKKDYDAVNRFEIFKKFHIDMLVGESDEGLLAVTNFLRNWDPKNFVKFSFPEEMKDRNIVFKLDYEYNFIHERNESLKKWKNI